MLRILTIHLRHLRTEYIDCDTVIVAYKPGSYG